MIYNVSSAKRVLEEPKSESFVLKQKQGGVIGVFDFFWKSGESSYERVWPVSL